MSIADMRHRQCMIGTMCALQGCCLGNHVKQQIVSSACEHVIKLLCKCRDVQYALCRLLRNTREGQYAEVCCTDSSFQVPAHARAQVTSYAMVQLHCISSTCKHLGFVHDM